MNRLPTCTANKQQFSRNNHLLTICTTKWMEHMLIYPSADNKTTVLHETGKNAAFYIIKITQYTIVSGNHLSELWGRLWLSILFKDIVSTLLQTTKTLLAQLWKSDSIPAIKSWYRKVSDYFIIKKKITVPINSPS